MVSCKELHLAGCLAAACLPQPISAQFGELPPNHVKQLALEGIRGEVAFYFLIDSVSLAKHVPAGLELVTAQFIASLDTATARFLSSRPHLRTSVPGVLLFSSLDSFAIDARPPEPGVIAQWWVLLRYGESVDARARDETWLQLAAWSPDTTVVRLLRPEWPDVRSAPVGVERLEDGVWSIALSLPDGEVRGRCRPSSPRSPMNYPLPKYTSVWNAGPQPRSFTLYTFYGHHSQECVGELAAEGSGFLATAVMRAPRDLLPWMKSALSDGWHSRAGLYRH